MTAGDTERLASASAACAAIAGRRSATRRGSDRALGAVALVGPWIAARAESHCSSVQLRREAKPRRPPDGPPVDRDGLAVHIFRARREQVGARLASSGIRPTGPSGCGRGLVSRELPGLSRAQAPSVGKGPGAMALKRMFFEPTHASDWVMMLRPALDIAEGTVNGPPFHTQVVRMEVTAGLPCAIQRLPQSRVTKNEPRKTMLRSPRNAGREVLGAADEVAGAC